MSTQPPDSFATPTGTIDFRIAFQPIVDVRARRVHGYEALLRGARGEGAAMVFAACPWAQRPLLDRAARLRALAHAVDANLDAVLAVNLIPESVAETRDSISETLHAARASAFPFERLCFEVAAQEAADDPARISEIMRRYRRAGLRTAMDDFGGAFDSLNVLADFQPDLVKLDPVLTRGIAGDRTRQALARAVVGACEELDIDAVAEGLESADDLANLHELGIDLFQGHLLGAPTLEQFAPPRLGALRRAAAPRPLPE